MNRRQRSAFSWFAASVMLIVGASAAWADAIDGNWCHQDGRRFSIRGPEITTPKGAHLQGNYNRHYFSYVAPVNEQSAGETINMTLRSEFTLHLQVGTTPSAPVEEWKRCAPDITRRAPSPVAPGERERPTPA